MSDGRRVRTKRDWAAALGKTVGAISAMVHRGRLPPPLDIPSRELLWSEPVFEAFLRTGVIEDAAPRRVSYKARRGRPRKTALPEPASPRPLNN